MKRLLASLLGTWLISLAALIPAFGADSTSFDPTTVQVKAKGSGGVPVGTIVAWPVAKNPSDMANWLECNGQSISQSAFPELFAVVGAKVPDLRGVFLRGYGTRNHSKNNGSSVGVTNTAHTSGSLGAVQGDATRNITGELGRLPSAGDPPPQGGAIRVYDLRGNGQMEDGTGRWMNFDASRVVPVANEVRPVNMAVRYLIRARP